MPSLNERAAKVMGWEKRERGREMMDRNVYYDPKTDQYLMWIFAWNPVEDYNQAMMLRDRCSALGLGERFAYILAGLTDCPASSSDWVPLVRRIAFATAAQITEAAVLTLEGEN